MTTKKPHISIVSPVYSGESCIKELCERLKLAVEAISKDYEIILVEDCGPDKSWQVIKTEAKKDARVRGIRLSKNFGQHSAISAGLDLASGVWIVVIDCDLQDSPEAIDDLYREALKGFDVVVAERHNRQDSILKRIGSKLFFALLSFSIGERMDHRKGNFGIYSQQVIQAVRSMGDSVRWFPGLINWVGFKYTSIPVQHGVRNQRSSSYNFSKLIKLATLIFLSSSEKPLHLTVKLGFIITFSSVIFGLLFIYKYIFFGSPVLGWTSLIVSIWFLGGVIIFILGIIGLYIGRIYSQSKSRPHYIISDRCN